MRKPVVHFEIGCDNLSETVEFYKDVFNWTIIIKDNSASIDTGKESGIPGHITELGLTHGNTLISISKQKPSHTT